MFRKNVWRRPAVSIISLSLNLKTAFIVFSDKDDNTIRFKKTDNSEEGVNGKLIEVRTKDTLKTIDRLMKASGYQKHGATYERGSRHTNTLTRCTLSTQGKTRILHYQKANK